MQRDKSRFVTGCYFEQNNYGFRQKRISGECLDVPVADNTRGIEYSSVLNPSIVDGRYGGVTKYLAVDCEMDMILPEATGIGIGLNVPVKVSIVNSSGQLVLDTLVRPSLNGKTIDNWEEIRPYYRSNTEIHGVKRSWLADAPTLDEVRDHINELCGKKLPKEITEVLGEVTSSVNNETPSDQQQHESGSSDHEDSRSKDDVLSLGPDTFDENLHSIFIGHGVTVDLKVLGMTGVPYYCTSHIDKDPVYHQNRKLKDLTAKHLNAQIQMGHHSPIIDARSAMALFLKFKDILNLEQDGPSFFTSGDCLLSMSGRRRKKRYGLSFTQIVHREAAKSLNIDGPELDRVPAKTKVSNFEANGTENASALGPVESKVADLIYELQRETGCGRIQNNRKYVVRKRDIEEQVEKLIRQYTRKMVFKM